MSVARDPRVDPRVRDVVRVRDFDYDDDATRAYEMTVTERQPRHVHARRVWPDGVTTIGRFWIREWRNCMSGAEVLTVAKDAE